MAIPAEVDGESMLPAFAITQIYKTAAPDPAADVA
jgi:hypothetical protein